MHGNGVSPDHIYDDYADKYDFLLREVVGYADPDLVAEMASNLNIPLEAKVVDFACGTGLTGQCLHKKGYSNLTGIDASTKMME